MGYCCCSARTEFSYSFSTVEINSVINCSTLLSIDSEVDALETDRSSFVLKLQ